MRSGSAAFRSVAKQWSVNQTKVLATIAIFCGTLAFSYGTDQPRMTVFTNAALALLAAGAGWLSYDYPQAALGALAILCLGSPVLSASFAALELVGVFVLFQVAWRSEVHPRLVAVAGFLSLSANDWWQRVNADLPWIEPTVLYPVILTALGVGLGFQGRRLRHQHAELLALQHANRERAILAERQRIARDLHDVAAHHLSALVVQNKLARRLATTEALEQAADFSSKTAGEALDALRRVVGVLSSDSPLEPQPALTDLPDIFERLTIAGLNLHITPPSFVDFPSLRRDVELAIVRITQESLTNVLRHRGPGNAWVDLLQSPTQITLTIEDDGDGQANRVEGKGGIDGKGGIEGALRVEYRTRVENRARVESKLRNETRHQGFGLINMTERAQSTGGLLSVESSSRGGWKIRAVFPREHAK
jgi:signal transduction histidine kinase